MAHKPLIITCAIVGAEIMKEDFEHLPVTPDELASSAHEAVKAGASIIHLHVRDENGKPSQRKDIFETVTKKIKKLCNPIIQYSTGGAVGTPVDERCAPLSLKPDMATLSMGTMNFGTEVFENTEDIIKKISNEIQKNNVMPELEIFDYGMLDTAFRFLGKVLIPDKFHMDFVLGVPGGAGGDVRNLVHLVDRLPENQTWTVAGVGRHQLPLTTVAIAMGGNVRVGFEDNIYYHKGETAKSNAQLVERIARIAGEFKRPVASSDEARQILGL
ncbi:MAG: 3-keto-5-aminohexanoate cleavage protein [Bacteriovoracaceae bacterium]|nr:3-keto-5-aminohexanoate cleavage protein [Bacteriovoracaceae bacterium]